MRTDGVFPVTKWTAVSLSCDPGFRLTGDVTVTCSEDTEYLYSIEPRCVLCPEGKYKSVGMAECEPCQPGKDSTPDRTNCVECSEGYYRTNGMTTCALCDPGKEPSTNKETCVECPEGKYRAADMLQCNPCAQRDKEPTPDKSACAYYCDEPTVPEAMFNPGPGAEWWQGQLSW
ncbi:hypothetical protein ACHWQZ_G005087 [Mnemiopsis leidyi]